MLTAAIALLCIAPAEARIMPLPAPIAAVANDPDAVAERFFAAWQSSGTDAALVTVKPDFAAVDGASDMTVRIRPNMEAAIHSYGKIVRWEKIASEPLGTLVRRDSYLVQHEHYVVIWRFVFAETSDGWVIQYWGFADDAAGWFD